MNDQPAVVLDADSETLVIHMERAGFADFVKGLLGQPQTIENAYSGTFDISKNDIESIFHLVHQRISQQNKSQLIQFSIKIIYSDNTSILINSLADFITNREIPARISIAANLNWTYLIQFEDRKQPERQVIELMIRADDSFENHNLLIFGRNMQLPGTGFKLVIQHTARTWAIDIENIISQQIRSWIIKESFIKRTIYNNSGWAGIFVGLLFFGLTATGIILATNSLEDGIRRTMGQALALTIDGKLDYLMQAILDARMQGPEKNIIMGGFISAIMAVIIGVFASIFADNPPNSYLLISENAATARKESLENRGKDWVYFFISGVTATIAGFLSKYIFLLVVGNS
jgi:hypothetical protein